MVAELKGADLFIDFTEFQYMNSSTVVPILHLLKKLDENSIKTVVTYDKESFWQVASFRGINTLAEERLLAITVKGK